MLDDNASLAYKLLDVAESMAPFIQDLHYIALANHARHAHDVLTDIDGQIRYWRQYAVTQSTPLGVGMLKKCLSQRTYARRMLNRMLAENTRFANQLLRSHGKKRQLFKAVHKPQRL